MLSHDNPALHNNPAAGSSGRIQVRLHAGFSRYRRQCAELQTELRWSQNSLAMAAVVTGEHATPIFIAAKYSQVIICRFFGRNAGC
jgi:hypothetical protein